MYIHHLIIKSLSCVWLFATPWTVAHQAPLSVQFFWQEHWSGLPFPSLTYVFVLEQAQRAEAPVIPLSSLLAPVSPLWG